MADRPSLADFLPELRVHRHECVIGLDVERIEELREEDPCRGDGRNVENLLVAESMDLRQFSTRPLVIFRAPHELCRFRRLPEPCDGGAGGLPGMSVPVIFPVVGPILGGFRAELANDRLE